MNVTLPLQTLTECDQEPIHTPGAIQPHGAMRAFDPADGLVTHASANLLAFLGIEPAAALGQPIAVLLGQDMAMQPPAVAQARRMNPGGAGLDAQLSSRSVQLLPFASGPRATCIDIFNKPDPRHAASALAQAHRVIQALRLSRTHPGLCSMRSTRCAG